MNYGFVIDNRMCIGCHACTVACKSEHNVPLGVNRTHVKYIEKGEFPNNTREFSVHRCNHCEAAPCVEICPTTAMHTRADGIVDFDSDRCIGCKSCMQACPYDALYIDPDTNTAAKCNYCAHRIDGGYEPACVIVCPVEAIISGDLDDSNSKISQLVAKESVVVRKPEKGTKPNLYYINGSSDMLTPSSTNQTGNYLWSYQEKGVGHFAKYAEKKSGEADLDNLLIQMALEGHAKKGTAMDRRAIDNVTKELQKELDKKEVKRVYDTPNKGVLWGWEVPAYVWTKAVATGTFIMMAIWNLLGGPMSSSTEMTGLGITLVFMMATGAFLVKDLDRPDRFLYVLLRPQWKSWLVRGAYIITAFGGLVSFQLIKTYFNWSMEWLVWPGIILAILGASYTAFLFAQAKARDFWQSPLSPVHMVVHAILAGSIVIMGIDKFSLPFMVSVLKGAVFINLAFILLELVTPHGTQDAKKAVELMTKGYYSKLFKLSIIAGNVIPLLLLFYGTGSDLAMYIAGGLILLGIYLTEFLRIRIPQLIPLS